MSQQLQQLQLVKQESRDKEKKLLSKQKKLRLSLFKRAKKSKNVNTKDAKMAAGIERMTADIFELRRTLEMNTNMTQDVANTTQRIDNITDATLDKTTQGFDDQKEMLNKEKEMLKKMMQEIKNIPKNNGCSKSSVSGLILCIYSLAKVILYVLYCLSQARTLLMMTIYNFSSFIVPQKLLWMVTIMMYWFQGLLLYLLVTAIGLRMGNEELADQMIVESARLLGNAIAAILDFSPVNNLGTAMQKTITYLPGLLHDGFIISDVKPRYEALVNSTQNTIETFDNMKKTAEYVTSFSNVTTYDGVNYLKDSAVGTVSASASYVTEGAYEILDTASNTATDYLYSALGMQGGYQKNKSPSIKSSNDTRKMRHNSKEKLSKESNKRTLRKQSRRRPQSRSRSRSKSNTEKEVQQHKAFVKKIKNNDKNKMEIIHDMEKTIDNFFNTCSKMKTNEPFTSRHEKLYQEHVKLATSAFDFTTSLIRTVIDLNELMLQ
jgi:hypothetical protein